MFHVIRVSLDFIFEVVFVLMHIKDFGIEE